MNENKIIIDSSEKMRNIGLYWNDMFLEPVKKVAFPTDFCKENSYREANLTYQLNNDLYTKVNGITKNDNLAIYVFLLTVFKIELFKYSNESELVIGSPVNFKSEEQIITNKILPFKVSLSEDMTFKEVLLIVKKVVAAGYKNQVYPLNEIIKKIYMDKISDVLPINCAMKNIHKEDHIKYIIKSSENQITFLIEKKHNSIYIDVAYNSELYDEGTVNRIYKIYTNIMSQVLDDINIKLSEIELITKEEKDKIIYDFNDTRADYSKNKTIQELFEEQVEKTPNNIAVIFGDKKLTYKELNEKANSLARVLRNKGVKADSIVAIMVERSLEMIIGIMGILKAGGAYLPIDRSYPKERIKYMLMDSGSKVFLSTENLINGIEFNGNIIDLSNDELYRNDLSDLPKIINSSNLAYVIYTSGTTGNPKGVMIEHKSLVNRLKWMQKKYPLSERDTILQKTTYTFDVSVWEILWWSLVGAKVCMLNPNDEKDPMMIMEAINKYSITTIHFVPSMLDIFLYCVESNKSISSLPSLRQVFCSGEALNLRQVSKFYKEFQSGKKLINLYGPTEATIDVSYFDCDRKDYKKAIPIGKPIDNTKFYILSNTKVQPINVIGELYISGDGLARGYLNRPELTAEKFIYNPFEVGTKMYKTGDLARWLPDGNVEFLGRIDNQVKIRGFRIELGEIENRLLQNESIKEAAVVVKENKEKEKYICAYIISEKNLDELILRDYLKETLPEYMVPTSFMKLEKMPLTANGKLDKKSLPEPNFNAVLNRYEAPRNEVEEVLVKIWSEVLGVENIGINDNFFNIGGHSLKATILVSNIHKEFNREIPLKDLFKYPTIKELSELIQSAKENVCSNINKIEEKDYYEASSAQKRMYMLQHFDKNSTVYNMPVIFELEGKIDKEKLEKTFRKLTERHEALRTYFETLDGEIIQRLQKSYEFKLLHRNSSEKIEDIINNFVRHFDLEKSPLFRVELVENKEKVYLLIDMHHIISDGVSISILIKEFVELYNGKNLKPLKLQYKDFAVWQNNFLKSGEMKKQEEYWITMYGDEIPVLNMPVDYERPFMQSFDGDSVSFEVDKDTTLKIRKLTRETGTTMHMVLLSAFNILLSKYSGQEDIVIGTPIAGRPHADLQNIMGMFVNTLALRNKPEEDKKFIDFLKEVKENSLNAYENQSYQLEALVEKLDIKRDTSRNPLFDVMFNIIDTVRTGNIKLDDITLKQYSNGNRISKFDLSLNALESDEKISFNLDYCSKLFKKETIEKFCSHYVGVLEAIINNNEIKLGEIDLLSVQEKNQIFYDFNDTKMEYSKDKTIQELFEEQVEKTPNNIAVVFEDKRLTYRELNERANSLAMVLRNKGVKSDSIVGIMVDRSLEMIVGIMGILKAGGAYLPIDLNYPKERIEYILKDSESKVILSTENLMESIEFNGLIIDLFNEELYGDELSNLEKINNSANLAYVIYTSGTTGNPKGVMIEHRNVNNLILGLNKNIYEKYNRFLKVGLVSPYYFDASVKQIFAAILNGHSLYIVGEEIRRDGERLLKYYEDNAIEFADGTPMHLKMLMNSNLFSKNKLVIDNYIIGGEQLHLSVVKDFYNHVKRNNGPCISNVYGPTECCVDSSVFFIDAKVVNELTTIPIGKPMINYRLYIINKHNQEMPIGVPGELCISGDGVARGYLNRPELTAEKFVDNPFETGTKMYKTGDLARWLPDGNIEFLGRIDDQVKLRGFRVELGEIENRLLQNEHIEEVAVIVKQNKDGEKYICAYVISEKALEKLELKSYLIEILPEYMVPSYFVQLEKMPLTANGKLDRRALPEPNLDTVLTEYEAPRNEIEENLTRIWSEVLGVAKVGINDNFFELGGQSLKATILMSRIHKELNKEVLLKELFKSPTIKGLSKYIESTEDNVYSRIEKVEEKEYYEASSAQKRMYMLQQFERNSIAYNMPAVFELEGKVDKNKIEEAFRKLTERHEALITSFETLDGEIIQRLQKNHQFKLEHRNSSEKIEDIVNDYVRSFDLDKSPLYRVELVESGEITYLLIDMHHIISDGISMNILINEFTEIYSGKTLEHLKLQYKDFAAWQNDFLKSEEMKKQEAYWTNMFGDEIPVLNMPTDYERPFTQSFDGDSVSFEVDKDTTLKLRKLTKETGTTMHMALLSAFNILLSKYSGQEDIVIGTPIAGRPHADLQNIMGIFVNTLALRNKPRYDKRYIDFLSEIKENSLRAYENQSYPLEALVERLDIKRDTSRNSLFDTMFNLSNTVNDKDIKFDDIVLKQYRSKNKVSKFDLTLNVIENDNKLIFSMDYCTKLFKKETIERLCFHYVGVLEAIINNNEIILGEIDLLSEQEKNQILYEFNDTNVDYPKVKTIQKLFEEQVEKTPNNIAVIFENNEITYRELDEKSNQLARRLRDRGVIPNRMVGLMLDRSIDMIVGILGILKAGGAYLPMEPSYPEDRIKYILENSNSTILVTSDRYKNTRWLEVEKIYIEDSTIYIDNHSKLEQGNESQDLAYTIYTSGSTGNPKGVMITHEAVINTIQDINNKFCINEKDRIIGLSSVCFDLSVYDIFGSLSTGAALVQISDQRNVREIVDIIKNKKITIWNSVPAIMDMLLESIPDSFYDANLRLVLLSGDWISLKLPDKIRKSFVNSKIVSLGGATEASIWSIHYLIQEVKSDWKSIPYGRPLGNQTFYILDKARKLCPFGVPGELYIGGIGLSKGYMNDMEKTKNAFIIHNEFGSLYRTGDWGRCVTRS